MRSKVALALATIMLCGCPPMDFLGSAQPDGGFVPPLPEVDAGSVVEAGLERKCTLQVPGPIASRYAPPKAIRSGACDEQTRLNLATCLGTQKPSECLARLDAAPAACRSCVVSASTDAEWGALVRYENGEIIPNQAGCWEALLASEPTARCGPAIHRRAECEILGACSRCTDPQPRERAICFKPATANNGPCRRLQVEEQACTFPVESMQPGTSVFARCIQTQGDPPAAYWKGLLDTFCGL